MHHSLIAPEGSNVWVKPLLCVTDYSKPKGAVVSANAKRNYTSLLFMSSIQVFFKHNRP